jgi:subtilisin family serine protease
MGCELPFPNLGKVWCLVPAANDSQAGVYRVSGKDLQVRLSDRLIVRTNGFTRKSLQALDSRIETVSELYLMEEAVYYSVNVGVADRLPAVIRSLSEVQGISLVQPDILQLRKKHAAEVPVQTPPTYLTQLGIPELWPDTQGRGVRVAVIDDGFDLEHEEFKHLEVVFSYDTASRSQDVSPRGEGDSHGTKVAGTVFAAHNGVGIDGIAPQASLIAIRQPDTWTSDTLLSFYLSKLSQADIVNASWRSQWLLEPVADIVADLAQNGRRGKGSAVVFSAGNSGMELTGEDSEAQLQAAVVIGAANGQGQRTRFSNYGQSVDLYVYGKASPAVVPGGYGRFSGTSLSAAVASGYFALLLSQAPSLTLHQLVALLQQRLSLYQSSLLEPES